MSIFTSVSVTPRTAAPLGAADAAVVPDEAGAAVDSCDGVVAVELLGTVVADVAAVPALSLPHAANASRHTTNGATFPLGLMGSPFVILPQAGSRANYVEDRSSLSSKRSVK
jgi:hypothetical protein